MIADPETRAALGALALARSARSTWDHCVRETVDAYRQVLSRS